MAAISTFSWAQVAKGDTHAASSQTTPSKVTSGTASSANGALTDITPGGNWADDVESSVTEKATVIQNKEQEENKPSQSKENAVEHAKADDRSQDVTSGISSPDLAASASTTTKEDDETSALNGTSSESTWDAKSQTSEPAWIADRKERQQNGAQANENLSKDDMKTKENPAQTPKQPVLQEAAPPVFNVWQQRIESQRAKMAAQTKSSPVMQATNSTALKENQRPQTGARRKANSMTGMPRETIAVSSEDINKSMGSKPAASESRTDSPLTGSSKATSTDRESAQAPPAPLPTMKNEGEWPTPENVPDKERKASTEKETDGQRNEDVTPTVKKGKQQWQQLPIPVTPITYKSDFKETKPRGPPNGDRPNRNGNGSKRPPRGASNPSGDRDKENPRSNSTPNNGEGVVTTQEIIPVAGDATAITAPSKPLRASSSSPRGQQKKDSLPGRKFSRQHTGDVVQSEFVQEHGRSAVPKDTSFSKPFHELRRTRSPKKMSDSEEKLPEEFVPKPIPRRTSIGTQTDDVGDNIESSTRETPPTRPGQFDSRKESRNAEGVRDSNIQPPRGGKRGSRGRGGNNPRDFPNGHQTFGAPSNGYGTDFPTASTYGVAQSPTLPGSRGNHQFSYPPQRGPWRGNPRSHSIPLENYYNQNPRAGYPGGHHAVHGIQTFIPAMYDMNGYPMSAIPYSPHMDSEHLHETVRMQVEYYFSVNNLIKDMFLRKHMDSQGFVFLDIIANFNRIKQLTQDRDIVKAVCISSSVIEVCIGEDGKERLRKREGWDQFTLPLEQREPSAQTAGPERLDRPQPPQLSLNGIPPQYRGPASAGLPNMHQQFSRRSYDSTYPVVNGYPPQFAAYPGYAEGVYAESMNGDEPRGRAAKSPIHENVISPTEQPIATALGTMKSDVDSFPDDQISVLTVVVKTLRDDKAPYHSAASRTFSNGSIDSRSIMSEMNKPSESASQVPANGETLVNGGENKLSLTRTLTPSKLNPSDRGTPSPDINVFWVKDQDYPVQNLPEDLTPEPYYQLRARALEDRSHAVTGNCPYDLEILYQFWCHFLLRNFNNSMYSEFKYYANDDAKNRFSFIGLNNLVQYYSKSLSSHHPIRDRVVKDYVELVKSEPAKMEGAAFKTLRSAWRNGALNLKNRKKLADTLDAQVKFDLDRIDI